MAVLHFAHLTPARLQALDRQNSVFILPVSLMEAHGEHLPLGTDYLLSDFFAQELARLLTDQKVFQTAVLFSALAVGAGGLQEMGTVNTAGERVEQLVMDYGGKLVQWGFRFALIISIHAGRSHLQALESVYERLRPRGLEFLPLTNRLLPWFFSEDFVGQINRRLDHPLTEKERKTLLADGHAGWWETSMMTLAQAPMVQRNLLPAAWRLDETFAKAALQAVLQEAMRLVVQLKSK